MSPLLLEPPPDPEEDEVMVIVAEATFETPFRVALTVRLDDPVAAPAVNATAEPEVVLRVPRSLERDHT